MVVELNSGRTLSGLLWQGLCRVEPEDLSANPSLTLSMRIWFVSKVFLSFWGC